MMSFVIAVIRVLLFAVMSLSVSIVQSIVLLLFRDRPVVYAVPMLWHKGVCRIFNIKVRVTGKRVDKRQVFFVSNHVSYLDIPVLGSILPATFISKKDVASWPVFGFLARLQKTMFISRDRKQAAKEKEELDKRIAGGESMILFPEGTSTNGKEVLPFKSSLFAIFFENDRNRGIAVQPVTISIAAVNGKPCTTDELRDMYAWYGDMEFTPHLWQFARCKGMDIDVRLHPPRYAKDFGNRKEMAAACHGDVAAGLPGEEREEDAEI